MLAMKKWLVTLSLLSLATVPVLAQNPPNWHDVRTIANPTPSQWHCSSLSSAPGVPFDSLFMAYARSGWGTNGNGFGLKRSGNLGVTFSDSLGVYDAYLSGSPVNHRTVAIAHETHGVHVVVLTNSGVYYLLSTNGGNSWSTPFKVNTDNNAYASVALEADPSGLTAFYAAAQGNLTLLVMCRRYTFGGNWSNQVSIPGSTKGRDPSATYVCVPPKNVLTLHVVYGLEVDGSVYQDYPVCQYSTDLGTHWTPEGLPCPSNYVYPNGPLPQPSIAANPAESNVYVAYTMDPINDGGLNFRIYCSKVGGTGFNLLTNLTSQTFIQMQPRLVIGAGDTLYAAWMDDRVHSGWPEIYFDRSGNGGQTWIDKPNGNVLISRSDPLKPYSCWQPDILADGIHQVVVWDSSDASGGYVIKYRKRSLDTKAPSAPTGLQVVWLNVVELYWTGVSDAAGYNVYRAPGTMPPFAFQKITPQPVIGTVYFDFSASPTGCYTYYVTAMDAGENESGSSNYAYYFGCSIGDQVASMDAGTPVPSPNTVRRAGYYSWGSTPDSTVDYDPDSLVYRFTGLAPDSFYLLGVGYFEGGSVRGRQQSLSIDGVQVHGASLLPDRPSEMVYLVPKQTYQDSMITVSFVKNLGPNAVVDQLWLYQAHFPNGGPQSAGVVDLKGAEIQLYPASPNPATSSVQFEYALASSQRVALALYDVTGRLVRTLVDREDLPGLHRLTWDGKDALGRRVKSGVYFARLKADSYQATQKVVFVR